VAFTEFSLPVFQTALHRLIFLHQCLHSLVAWIPVINFYGFTIIVYMCLHVFNKLIGYSHIWCVSPNCRYIRKSIHWNPVLDQRVVFPQTNDLKQPIQSKKWNQNLWNFVMDDLSLMTLAWMSLFKYCTIAKQKSEKRKVHVHFQFPNCHLTSMLYLLSSELLSIRLFYRLKTCLVWVRQTFKNAKLHDDHAKNGRTASVGSLQYF